MCVCCVCVVIYLSLCVVCFQVPRFKQLLVDTVLDGIEDNLKMKLDRQRIVYLRMPYKGVPTATVIREKAKNV